jgi:hypothetical protein
MYYQVSLETMVACPYIDARCAAGNAGYFQA